MDRWDLELVIFGGWTEANFEEAAQWYEKAAKQGNAVGQNEFGVPAIAAA